MSREKQRTAAIRQKLENLKAEMAAQDRELTAAIEGAGISEADLAAAREDFAEVIDAQEPLRMQTETVPVAAMAIRV